jgi:hypothetical protein
MPRAGTRQLEPTPGCGRPAAQVEGQPTLETHLSVVDHGLTPGTPSATGGPTGETTACEFTDSPPSEVRVYYQSLKPIANVRGAP